MSSDFSLEGVIDDKLEGAVSGTEYFILEGPNGEVIGIIYISYYKVLMVK